MPEDLSQNIKRTKVAFLAQQLEKKIFAGHGNNMLEYSDTYVLENRLRSAAVKLLTNVDSVRYIKKKEQIEGFVSERKKVLLEKVGQETFDEIFRIDSEIRTIRMTSNTWAKAHSLNFSQSSNSLPSPIRAIYFGCKLTDAVRLVESKAPCLNAKCVINPEWESLLVDAQEILRQFRQFEREVIEKCPKSTSTGFGFGCSCLASSMEKCQIGDK